MKKSLELQEFDDYCKKVVDKHKIPGFTIGLASYGEMFFERGYGYRNVKEKLPINSDTLFGIGSVTKSLTCVAIMQLQEQGNLSVHSPVTYYIPEFKTPNKEYTDKITIHHLMTHTTGIPPLATLYATLKRSILNDQDDYEYINIKQLEELNSLPSIKSTEQLLSFMADQDYEFLGEPGKEFSYLNDGYALLGIIIERVSGQSYESYLKSHILSPLKMNHSVFYFEELAHYENITTIYDSCVSNNKIEVFRSNNHWEGPPMIAAAFLKSTVNDMLKYAEIFRNNGKSGNVRILKPESVEQMLTPFIECDVGKYYGYGLRIIPDFFGYKLVGHGGAIKGSRTKMFVLPELNLTSIAFANLQTAPTVELTTSALTNFLGKGVKQSNIHLKEIDVPLKKLKQYEGHYASQELMNIQIWVDNGKLTIKTAELPTTELIPVNKDLFLLKLGAFREFIRFLRNSRGEVFRVLFMVRQLTKLE